MTHADIDALVARLRSFGEAYPEDVFGPVTEQEIKDHASLITRNSAAMGRHCAKFMLEAAAALAALKADAERTELELETQRDITDRIRADTIEECARVCDGVQTDIAWRKIDAQYQEACEDCARAIRQLASSAGLPDQGTSGS